jgi:parvulin-like peptidyl-prolyl isomerase
MTFRPPAKNTTRRRSRQTDSRRAIVTNIAFGLAILAAIALLGSVLAGNWYADHLTPVASVNGVAISKDAVRARANADLARVNRLLDDYDLLRNQGKITTTDEQQLVSSYSTEPSSVYSSALSELTEQLTLQQYADQHGISVSDSDVQAQIAKDGTLPESRHVKVIAVEPTITPPNSVPTPEDMAAGQRQAQAYRDEITIDGKNWDDVFKESQTDNPVVSSSGDMGMYTKDTLGFDPDFVDAIFSLKNVNDITTVFKGSDGIYRFATVTAIVAPYVDSGWQDAINSSGNGDEYQRVATAEALKAKIQAQVEAQYVTGASPARQVQDIFVSNGYGSAGDGDEIRARLIIFAPNHDATNASSVPTTDPAWADAKARADAAYAAIQKDPSQFGKIAYDSKQNDDSYLASVAGQLPWLPETIYEGNAASQAGLGMIAVPAALFQGNPSLGLQPPILEPSMGYVLADYQGRRPAPDQRIADAQLALATGADFATVAKEYSESDDVNNGANLGWVFKYQLSDDLESAIFQAPVGGLTRVVLSNDGWHLYKVLAAETRAPDATQQLKLKKLVFPGWLNDLTTATNIWTDQAALTAITPTATP